jgi:hypothetical protein
VIDVMTGLGVATTDAVFDRSVVSVVSKIERERERLLRTRRGLESQNVRLVLSIAANCQDASMIRQSRSDEVVETRTVLSNCVAAIPVVASHACL